MKSGTNMEMKVKIRNGKIIEPLWRVAWRRLNCWLTIAAFQVTDCLPWFARKRLFNWLLGSETLTDFSRTDALLHCDDNLDRLWVCLKDQ